MLGPSQTDNFAETRGRPPFDKIKGLHSGGNRRYVRTANTMTTMLDVLSDLCQKVVDKCKGEGNER